MGFMLSYSNPLRASTTFHSLWCAETTFGVWVPPGLALKMQHFSMLGCDIPVIKSFAIVVQLTTPPC